MEPFHVKDCTLAAIATGIKAQTLLELRDKLTDIPLSSIYFHFWGGRIRSSYEHREYHNDFSFWSHRSLRDEILAERLELLNPNEFNSLEELKTELIEIVENRLDEKEYIPWAKIEEQFHFIECKIVVFHTKHILYQPQDLLNILPLLTKSSLFYHFIDSTRRVPGKIDDFSVWLQQESEQYGPLISGLHKIDPYLISLTHLQEKLVLIASDFFSNKPL